MTYLLNGYKRTQLDKYKQGYADALVELHEEGFIDDEVLKHKGMTVTE